MTLRQMKKRRDALREKLNDPELTEEERAEIEEEIRELDEKIREMENVRS